LYSETAASWLPFLVIGGLILWIGRRRKRKVRDLLIPENGLKAGRPRLRNRHAVLGIWLAIGLLAISVTGLTWSNYAGARFQALVTALNGRTPSLSAVVPTQPVGTPTIGVDRALAAGRQAGLAGSLTVTPPKKSGAAYTVAESFQTLPVRSDSVAVDPYSGAVVGQLHFADYPLSAKLTTLGILLHSGTLFGLANQVGMALLALGTLVMIMLGYRMWWQRRPQRAGQRRRLAPPLAKPIWSQLSKPVVLLAVLVTVAVGWALPVLGATLILFLAAEFGLYAIRRLRPIRQPVG
jgi:uncharacterized iron-regulated membrane protein